MEGLLKLQEHCLDNIQKGKSNFMKSPKERITVPYIEARLENLEKTWVSFCNTHSRIISEFERDIYSKTNYFKSSTYDTVEDLYIDYKCSLKERLSLLTIKGNTTQDCRGNGSEPIQNSNFVKLPKIVIPNFSGKYVEWPTFHDLFDTLVHKNITLANVQKLHYLKAHLTDEAEQLIRHVPITEANYEQCWLMLKKRFSNKRYISNCILNRLVGQKQLSLESSQGIKQLLDTTTECLNALSNIGVNVSTWDLIIIHLIANKLDSDTRKDWETKASEISDDLPTLEQFQEFLEHKFRSLEFLDSKSKLKANTSNVKVVHLASMSETDMKLCQYCEGNHKINNCRKFAEEEYETRQTFVRSNRLCFNCLGINHPVFSCRLPTRCRICKRKHHSLLHPSTTTKPADPPAEGNTLVAVSTTEEPLAECDQVVTCFSKINSQVLLATALVKIESRKTGNDSVLRCLLDQGSQASFITESAVQLLGLQKFPNNITVTGLGGQEDTVESSFIVNIKIHSVHDPKFIIIVQAHVLSKLTKFIPTKKVVIPHWPELVNIKLADPKFSTPNKIDVLLGAEVYAQILEEGLLKGPPGCPIAQKTKLGWILSGKVNSEENDQPNQVISLLTQVNDNELLRKFWELEAEPFPSKKILTQDEKRCEEIFARTTYRDETGRYVVKLPFRETEPKCIYGKTESIAIKRFQMLEKRFFRDACYKDQYTNVIEEYIRLGHMELVPEQQRNINEVVYLPHHGVIKENSTTTKLRVVFDASCVGVNGVSLNKELLVGPSLQYDLRHIVMRWRRHRMCFIADIVKMYRQVRVTQRDADFQRIIWRDEDGVLQHYRMLRVTFGTASAPYLAVKVLQQLAYDEGPKYPMAAERTLTDYYIDDLMTGFDTLEEGKTLYKEMNELMLAGGFQLQKWSCNHAEVLEEKGQTEANEEKKEIGSTGEIQKVLGLKWSKTTDEFEYSLQIPPLRPPLTKRRVISDIARLFDPLGWISPIIIRAKIFIQRIWMSGIEWDDELPEHLLQEWLDYRSELCKVTGFRIPRWIHMSPDDKSREIHGFSDASCEAYAAVVYLRVIDKSGEVHVNLITSKTKVAPVKQVSVPRLELCGAQLLAMLLREVAEILEVSKENIHAWTDSSIVLAWLSSHPSRWKTFVANRVSDILQCFDRNCWSHVKSDENPADCASRGVNPTNFEDSQLWKQGPAWLSKNEIKYSPLPDSDHHHLDTELEIKPTKLCCTSVNNPENELFSRFSTLQRLVRVISFCQRFFELTHIRPKPQFLSWLSNEELQRSLNFCILECQKHHFGAEFKDLLESGSVSKKSKISTLNPYIDSKGILRVGGRLDNAAISENMKHPILLPQKSKLTDLVVEEAHQRTLHGGPQSMVYYIRTKYWIVRLKSLAKYCVRRCVKCLRYSAQNRQPIMGNLPQPRVSCTRPFLHSGVDYAGPFAIRTTKGRGYRATKGYICLFICMATRAIHLETVSDMTSEGFLAAYKRFVARRGHCAELWSDNGSNFVGADRELRALLIDESSTVAAEIAECLAFKGTKWHRIPPHSPNFGGLWEAGIKSTKHHLKRVLGESTLTFEEFSTVLYQIEACLNSRPISRISENVDDPQPLTPGHFLVGEPLVLLPDANYEKSNVSSLRRWQLTQRMVQHFWRRWSREYLDQFFRRYKWNVLSPEPRIGEVVLVMENDLPPARWLYGVILDKHVGSDGITRVVSLRCKNTVIKRPTSKLCFLPETE